MEDLLFGVGLIVVGYLIDWIINPVGMVGSTIRDMFKWIGAIVVCIGCFQFFFPDKEDDFDYSGTRRHQIIIKDDDDDSEDNSVIDYSPIPSEAIEYNNGSLSPNNSEQTREPIRSQCRACRGLGSCPVCGGIGQTESKLGYSYSDGMQALPEKCKACKGSTLCRACGGDGWLDEGVDF